MEFGCHRRVNIRTQIYEASKEYIRYFKPIAVLNPVDQSVNNLTICISQQSKRFVYHVLELLKVEHKLTKLMNCSEWYSLRCGLL